MEYVNSTLTTNSALVGQTQSQSSISACREVTEKYLHTLAEEIHGLNGTFAAVLRAKTPQADDSPETKALHSCEIVEFLNGINSRIGDLMDEVRSLRERCEL